MPADTSSKIESLSEALKKPEGPYQRWIVEITAAEKELDRWKKKARKIVKEFRAERTESEDGAVLQPRRFNLFAANTQLMKTSLINQLPAPSVDREFNDHTDDVGRVSGLILERALSYQARKSQTKFFDIVKQVVQDNLVPGVGLSWHTYKADIAHREEASTIEGEKPLVYDEVVGEEILDEYVYWEDVVWSPARTWGEVRWIGRKLYMTKDKLVERFKEKGKKVSLDYSPKKQETSVESKNLVFQQAIVYEIWDKDSKKIFWLSRGFDELLEEKEDFLKLKEFFPCPRPFFATVSNGQLIPIPDYEYARDQYRELNEINTRISLLIKACRVVGAYDKASGQLTAVLNNSAENILIPVDSWAAFAEKGGLKGVIDWIPLDQIVAALDQLYKGREDVKQQIYEVTGMSDIIRGASKASETLGAQKLKAQYASMRIQERQKDVVTYVSSIFDIQGQLIRKHMDSAEIGKMAQIESMNEDQQLVAQAMQLLKSPDFELRCQVESDSLSDIDFQAEKTDRVEYMTAVTQFIKEAGGFMQSDPIMGPFMAQLLQFSLAGFRVGKKFEGQLDKALQAIQQKLAQPQQPQKTPEERKADAEIAARQQESQLKAQDHKEERQHKGQLQAVELQGKQREQALKGQAQQADLAAKQQSHSQALIQQQEKAMLEASLPRRPTNG